MRIMNNAPLLRSSAAACELRCHCGQLLARWRDGALEIKCKRCRRILSIPLAAIGGTPPLWLP